MKPIASTMTEVDHLPGEEVEFTISDANKAWVMRSMADLYSNRELACVREYSTNAYDANKEKAMRDGHEVKPIIVTLPSAMNPYFSVQDYGVGMSEYTLKKVYTQFGESTKRDSDEFNGMLGFGSKSAVAYTNTFTITAVQNGRKTVAAVTRREDAMGGYLLSLKVVLSIATTEPDGVNVQIPVHNWREFERKAMDFYRFWPSGTVLVNNREPEQAVGDEIAKGLYMSAQQGVSYVVMGNVPYRINNPEALFPRGMNRISFVAYLDPCDCDYAEDTHAQVEFTPSREDLKYSEHTKHHLHKIIDDFVKTSVDTAKKEIAGAKTHAEAYKAWAKWRRIIGAGQVDDLAFKGDTLVESFPLKGYRYDTQAYRYGTWTIQNWDVSNMEFSYIITGFDINLSSSHKKKVKDWLRATSRQARYVVFTSDDKVSNPWVDPARVVTWEKVKEEAPKAPKKARSASPNANWGRKAGSFDLITRSGRKVEQDVPSSKELYFVMTKEYNERRDLAGILDEFNLDHEVVIVSANRRDKFLRHYPHAKPVLPMLESLVKLDGASLITKDGTTYLSMAHNERPIFQHMDENRVNDPKIKELIRIVKKGEAHYTGEYQRQYRLASILGLLGKFKRHQYEGYWQSKFTPMSDSYPLALNFNWRLPSGSKVNEQIYIYMNAVYTARKDGKNV